MNHLLVFDDDPGRSARTADALSASGFRTTEVGPGVVEAGAVFKRERVAVVVAADGLLAEGSAGSALLAAAKGAGVPILAVVEDDSDPAAVVGRVSEADDWVRRGAFDSELPARVAGLIKRRGEAVAAGSKAKGAVPADSDFFALVVHDLRTPLNVIGLSLRMISQAVPKGDPELEEDLRFVDENFRQIDRMLTQLGDFYRLFENEGTPSTTPFSPRRMIDELLEARSSKAGTKTSPVRLDLRPDCPGEVDLDPHRARLAVQYTLVNAGAAAQGDPIRLTMSGGPDRWIIEVAVDKPAPGSVQSFPLASDSFERLCGVAAERRGMDLAIAAKVTESFGGSARLDVGEGRGTNVVLDWPARLGA